MNVLSKLNQILKYQDPPNEKSFRFPEDENEDKGIIENILVDHEKDGNKDQEPKSEENADSRNKGRTGKKDEGNKSVGKSEDKEKKSKKQVRELKKPIEVASIKGSEKDKEGSGDNLSDLQQISKDLKKNADKLEFEFNIPTNQDVVIREFLIKGIKKAFIIYVDGMIDKDSVNEYILKQLMLSTKTEGPDNNEEQSIKEKQLNKEEINIDYICNNLLAINQIKKEKEFEKLIPQVLNGLCALFIEGDDCCVVIETRGYEKRSVTTPQNETVIKGPHEAFIENLRTNLTLIRRIIRNRNLITEIIPVGKLGNISCAIVYMKEIANPMIVNELKTRINNINIDFIPGGGIMEQLVEDHPLSLVPQILTTERPDRTASLLMQGHVAIVSDGTPSASLVPMTFFNMMHTTEDTLMRFPYGVFLRTLRFLTILIALLVPGLYAALNLYHQEMIPTELLMSLYGTRQNTPFPIVFEILLMELSFEIIREAGVRVPGAIGQTLGIIGAIVLGDAAVSAQLVSPALIIVVAITGLCGFVVPSQSLSFGVRISRFFFTIMGAVAGFYGIALSLFAYTAYHASIKSFGVPVFSPVAPKMNSGYTEIIRGLAKSNSEKPDYLNTVSRSKIPEQGKASEKGDE